MRTDGMTKAEIKKELDGYASFYDAIYCLVYDAEKPCTMTKFYKELKELCNDYGMDLK